MRWEKGRRDEYSAPCTHVRVRYNNKGAFEIVRLEGIGMEEDANQVTPLP